MRSLFAAALIAIAASASGEQASVDFGSTIRPLTHAGSGVLHSINATTPDDSLLSPIQPSTFRAGFSGGAHERSVAHNADFQLIVSSAYNYAELAQGIGSWPGDNDDWTEWEAICRDAATQAVAEGKDIQFDIWNEPDQPAFWDRSQEQFLETWKHGVNAIRSVNPNATIVGPSTSVYWMFTNLSVEKVLTYAKANDVVPDVISWHSWGRDLTTEIDRVRQFAAANNIDASRISVNEYLWWFDQYRPGPVVYFLDAIEKEHVESGIKSCWGTCKNNSLDGLVTANGEPRSNWWLYERYGRMTGTSVMTVSGGETLDVVASQDEGVAYALVGRYKDTYKPYRDHQITIHPADEITPAEVFLENLDDVPSLVFGDKVHVLAELIKNSETAVSSGPVVKIDADFTTVNGQLTLSLPDFGTFDAYFLTLTAVNPSSMLPGDFNNDGIVDAADYIMLRHSQSDDFATAYSLWRSHFGESQLISSSVPEPSALLLSVIFAPLLAFCSCLLRTDTSVTD